MAEYIELDILIKKIDDYFSKTDPNGQEQIGVLKCRGIIREMPPADVAPVKHGKWTPIVNVYGRLEGWLHIECGRQTNEMSNYCPNCGAKMDWEV